MLLDKDVVDDGVDTDDSSNDLENLKESVKQLSAEVGQLQSELNAAKLLEFETSEQNANLIQVSEFRSTNQKTLCINIVGT